MVRPPHCEEFFQLSLDMLCVAGTDGYFKVLNAAWETTLGWSTEELLASPRANFVHPEDLQRTLEQGARVAAGQPAISFSNRYRCKDGSYKWLLWNALSDATGELIYATARDITAQKTAHDELLAARDALSARVEERTEELRLANEALQREATERESMYVSLQQTEGVFRRLFDGSPDAMLMVAQTGTILIANAEADRAFGYAIGGLIGQSLHQLLPSRLREAHVGHTAGYFAGPRTRIMGQGLDLKAQRRNGAEFPVDVSLSSFSYQDRPVALCVVRDLTERRKLEYSLERSTEQLRQAQKMDAIGTLAGGVAHDFNNLLSVILSYTALLSEDLKASDPIRGDILEIEAAARRGADLTRQLLAFGRRQVVQPRPLDLNDVLQGLQRMLQRLIGEGIELTVLHTAGLGTAVVDQGQVEQMVVNLVVNARDAMPDGGKLTVEAANAELDEGYAAAHVGVTAGPHVVLVVSDTGTGMDAPTQARIFEPFFTTKEMGKGTGLGLATVHGMVNQNRGHIWVYSEPGRGTTMKIYFPRAEIAPVKHVVSSRPPSGMPRGSETILLVEDEEPVRVLVYAILRRLGYHVLAAASGGDALLLCEQHGATIHLMLTDVVMPRMNGRQLAQRLRPLRPEMKVLYMSGYTDNSTVHHGVLDSDVAFLQKPITPDTLAHKVREVLDAATAR